MTSVYRCARLTRFVEQPSAFWLTRLTVPVQVAGAFRLAEVIPMSPIDCVNLYSVPPQSFRLPLFTLQLRR